MKKSYKADLKELPAMLRDILQQAGSVGFEGKQLHRIELVAEEALVNIIDHGYDGQEGTIDVECSHTEQAFRLCIRDRGKAFNPLTEAPQVDVNAPLEDRTYGGYGIFLIREIMDEVQYERRDGYNVFTMIKLLDDPS